VFCNCLLKPAGEADWTSLAFSPSGKPYVAYQDFGNYMKATVMKYDSVMVDINEKQELKFSLYPNPVLDLVTIETLMPPDKRQ